MASLWSLPDELVDAIIVGIDNEVGNLAQTCRRLHSWIMPGLQKQFAVFTVTGSDSDDDEPSSGVEIQKHLLHRLSCIIKCPSLRLIPTTAYIENIAFPDVKQWHCVDQELPYAERMAARKVVGEASTRAGFRSRGQNDEDNLDFLTGLAILLSPNLREVRVDFNNITQCQFLAQIANFRCTQNAFPGDASTWVPRESSQTST